MSAIGDAIGAIREALKLADDVRRTGETVKELARELREHDRRITRLEAQWETALALTQRSGMGQRRLGKGSGE
jgi:predicted RNase H-like nuclease (RuvC/YqgF family)